MKTRILCFAAALAFAPGAFAVYKCVDEKGVTRIGETPPDECNNVPMQEVSRSGTVLRTIAPSLTAEQVKAQQDAAERAKQAAKEAAEQQRKDLALVNTYSSEHEIDMTRDRNIEPITGRVRVANERIEAVDKRIKEIEEEMEFYKAGKSSGKDKAKPKDAPEQLKDNLSRAKAEKVALEKSLVSYDKEIAGIRAKYDADKKRWIEIKSGLKPREEAKGPTTITLSAGAAGIAKCGDKVYECPAGQEYICREQRPGERIRQFKVACVVPSGTSTPAR